MMLNMTFRPTGNWKLVIGAGLIFIYVQWLQMSQPQNRPNEVEVNNNNLRSLSRLQQMNKTQTIVRYKAFLGQNKVHWTCILSV